MVGRQFLVGRRLSGFVRISGSPIPKWVSDCRRKVAKRKRAMVWGQRSTGIGFGSSLTSLILEFPMREAPCAPFSLNEEPAVPPPRTRDERMAELRPCPSE